MTAGHGGVEVGTQGDGFFVRFADSASATTCAVELQERCRDSRAAGSELPPVRIGIHQGEAVHDDDDILGQVVNVAARLLEVAAPGEILVTEPVADGVSPDRLTDRGLVALKGIAASPCAVAGLGPRRRVTGASVRPSRPPRPAMGRPATAPGAPRPVAPCRR
ncbi:MAG: adenylate/guanylate cyclase domain-containing protein [Acidimicrobiales bacterium]